MYILPVNYNKCRELIIIKDENDLKEMMENYLWGIIFCPNTSRLEFEHIYYSEDEIDVEVEESSLIDDYDCIKNENWEDENYDKIYLDKQIVKIDNWLDETDLNIKFKFIDN